MTENTPEPTPTMAPIDDPNATQAAAGEYADDAVDLPAAEQAPDNVGDDAGVDEDGN